MESFIGYELQITRADNWTESEEGSIATFRWLQDMKKILAILGVVTFPVMTLSLVPAFGGLVQWIRIPVELWLFLVMVTCLAILIFRRFRFNRLIITIPLVMIVLPSIVASLWIASHRFTMSYHAYHHWHFQNFRIWYPFDPFRIAVALSVIGLFTLCLTSRVKEANQSSENNTEFREH